MTRVKICGITTPEDALHAAACGADAVGFIFADSPRRLDPERARVIMQALDPFVVGVGVFVDAPVAEVKRTLALTGCSVAQLHGSESPDYITALAPYAVVKVMRVCNTIDVDSASSYKGVRAILLDTLVAGRTGGTGQRFDAACAVDLIERGWRVIVAGGLTPENVAELVTSVRPFGVDVSTGVEISPGRKDPDKVARFIQAVRTADAEAA